MAQGYSGDNFDEYRKLMADESSAAVAESMIAVLENAIVVAGVLGDEIEQQSFREKINAMMRRSFN